MREYEEKYLISMVYIDNIREPYLFDDMETAKEFLWEYFEESYMSLKEEKEFIEIINEEFYEFKDFKEVREFFEKTQVIPKFGYIVEEPVMGVEE